MGMSPDDHSWCVVSYSQSTQMHSDRGLGTIIYMPAMHNNIYCIDIFIFPFISKKGGNYQINWAHLKILDLETIPSAFQDEINIDRKKNHKLCT